MKRPFRLLVCALLIPLLGGCVNDGATYQIDGSREHVLSLIREQPYFWDKKVVLTLVVSRMPACMRRHPLGSATENTRVEVWQVPSGAYIIKAGKRMFATETQTCESWARVDGEPEGGMGELRGTFRVKGGELTFVKEVADAADAAQ